MVYETVEIEGVGTDQFGNPVVILRGPGDILVPIWIGYYEAAAIVAILRDESRGQLIHTLIHKLLSEHVLNAPMKEVRVVGFENKTYLANLILNYRGIEKTIDCRPSDGIILAMLGGKPIKIENNLLYTHGVYLVPETTNSKDDPIRRLENLLEGINLS